MRDFSASLNVAVGLLILLLSGTCTLSVAPGMLIPHRLASGAPELWNGPDMAPLVALFGAAPMAARAALAAAGLKSFDDRPAARRARQVLLWVVAALGVAFAATWGIVAALSLEHFPLNPVRILRR